MNRWFFRIILLVSAALFCCGCARVLYDPSIPYGLLIKCRDFLTFCIFLADQEKPYYNHIAQRYYYAMLALASISYQWNKGHGMEYKVVKHDETWKMMPHDVKRVYGGDLKGLRTCCDYHYNDTARDMGYFRDGLSNVLREKDTVFPQLENKARSDYAKFFGEGITDEIKREDLDLLMEEINGLHEELAARVNNTTQNRMS